MGMDHTILFSSRPTESRADFRPDDPSGDSPYAQLRRLSHYLDANTAGPDDITDCTEAITYLRELTYRKIFTGTTHEQFVKLDTDEPEAIDWLIAVHAVDAQHHQTRRNSEKRN